MSKLFCNKCNNFKTEITTPSLCSFKCEHCNILFDITDEETIRYNKKKEINLMAHTTLLKNAGSDPVNPKVIKKCKKCKNNIVKQIRIGENMKLINTCVKCGEQWMEM